MPQNKMIWNPERECAEREQMHQLQSEQLSRMIQRMYDHVPFYRNRFKEKGIEPGDISSVEQLKELPFTTKDDLRGNFPLGHLW